MLGSIYSNGLSTLCVSTVYPFVTGIIWPLIYCMCVYSYYLSVTIATTHYQSTHPGTNYPLPFYTPTQANTQSIPMMVHRPPVQPSTALSSRHNVPPPPQAVNTTSSNSRNVITSPFDIPSLGCVKTTAQSSWPDLMSNSYNNMSSSVKSNPSSNNSSSSRVTRPVSSLPVHQPPLVFPSNPEPFQGKILL